MTDNWGIRVGSPSQEDFVSITDRKGIFEPSVFIAIAGIIYVTAMFWAFVMTHIPHPDTRWF